MTMNGTVPFSRPFLPATRPKHHPKSHCLLIRRIQAPVKFARDHSRLYFLARERLQHTDVFGVAMLTLLLLAQTKLFEPVSGLANGLRFAPAHTPLFGYERAMGRRPSRAQKGRASRRQRQRLFISSIFP